MWDPRQYLIYADERSRPFHDLVARVQADHVGRVADLGCGPGALTAGLVRRWPRAHVIGVDSSPQMIEKAREHVGVEFVQADVREWAPNRPLDVLLSNAMLQWVPDHLELMPRLASFLAPDGWLAFQLPANFGAPTHVHLRELAASPSWGPELDITWPAAHEPAEYLNALLDIDLVADVWETTYLHLLNGPDAVLEWLRGSALRPVVAQLTDAALAEFLEEYRARLHDAYPAGRHGTVLPYRRIFAIARSPRR